MAGILKPMNLRWAVLNRDGTVLGNQHGERPGVALPRQQFFEGRLYHVLPFG